jgi:hypothetical protein
VKIISIVPVWPELTPRIRDDDGDVISPRDGDGYFCWYAMGDGDGYGDGVWHGDGDGCYRYEDSSIQYGTVNSEYSYHDFLWAGDPALDTLCNYPWIYI